MPNSNFTLFHLGLFPGSINFSFYHIILNHMLTFLFHFSQFNNLSVFPENPSLLNLYPEYIIKIIIKIIRYFWGVTVVVAEELKHDVEKQEVYTVEVLISMRNLGGSPN